jgi:hypothetical protein
MRSYDARTQSWQVSRLGVMGVLNQIHWEECEWLEMGLEVFLLRLNEQVGHIVLHDDNSIENDNCSCYRQGMNVCCEMEAGFHDDHDHESDHHLYRD